MSTARWMRVALVTASIGWVVPGCATPGFLGGRRADALPPLPAGGAPTLTALETLRRTQEMSLYPERLDRRFLVGALDALEARFDSVRFEDRGDHGALQVGDALAEVPLDPRFDVATYLTTLTRAVQFVEANLREERDPKDDDLELIALRGGLFAVDKYATIFSGRSTEDFKIRFSGHLKGIGSTIGRENGNLVAVRVFPDSPAARGGLQSGDVILAIDGQPTQPLSVSGAVDRIRGEAGTRVVLRVQRQERTLELEITRGDVIVPSVETRSLDGGIGYAWVNQVSRTTGSEFETKVADLGDVRGLVLDLRGNSGGAMSGAQQLADFFLDDHELIVRVVARGGIEPPGPGSRLVAYPGVEFRIPTVVLVDPLTASAAEILSGALAPLPSVTVLGQRTFGKGVIQQVVSLPQENLLKLTVAQYLLSSDRVVEDIGIEPDIVLTPVLPDQLGALASMPQGSIPYLRPLRKPGEEAGREPADIDPFPVEAARLLLASPPGAGLAEIRKRSAEQFAQALAPYGVRWIEPDPAPPLPLPQPLRVVARHTPLAAGRPATLHVEVRNPNPFPLRDVWVALDGADPVLPKEDRFERQGSSRPPAPAYLSNKIVALGEVPAGGSAAGAIELTPPEGVAALDHPIAISVASGMRPLHRERLVVTMLPQLPDLQVAVQRIEQRLSVDVSNRGAGGTGPVLVEVEGANRSFENIAAGVTEHVELPLSGDAKELAVTLSGPWARRRISLPIPEAPISVAPPRIEIARSRGSGAASVRVMVSDPAGLREGWLVLDDQKETYVAWSGERKGDLRATIDERTDHRLAVKVESGSGVSVIEAIEFSAPAVAQADLTSGEP